MRLLARLLLVLIASVTGWLGSGTPLALGDSTSPPVVHVYDSQHHSAVAPRTITERGPPNATYDYTTYEAVDRWSPGATARSDDATTPAIYDYDDTARFVRTKGGSHGVEWPTSIDEAGFALVQRSSVAAKGGGALVKYDADFAIGQLTKGGRGTASGLVDLAESQGWKAVQSSGGPLKYFDSNGIERLVIKRGSARTPGSDFPHVAIRNASGRRVDPYGNLVTRKSPGNHTTITWDIP